MAVIGRATITCVMRRRATVRRTVAVTSCHSDCLVACRTYSRQEFAWSFNLTLHSQEWVQWVQGLRRKATLELRPERSARRRVQIATERLHLAALWQIQKQRRWLQLLFSCIFSRLGFFFWLYTLFWFVTLSVLFRSTFLTNFCKVCGPFFFFSAADSIFSGFNLAQDSDVISATAPIPLAWVWQSFYKSPFPYLGWILCRLSRQLAQSMTKGPNIDYWWFWRGVGSKMYLSLWTIRSVGVEEIEASVCQVALSHVSVDWKCMYANARKCFTVDLGLLCISFRSFQIPGPFFNIDNIILSFQISAIYRGHERDFSG